MDDFCGSEFLNVNKTWNSNDPELTPCFEETVLIWIPCAFLILFSPLDVYYMRSSLNKIIPWNLLNASKGVINVLLIVLCAADFIVVLANKDETTYPVNYVTPLVKCFSFILAAALLYFNVRFGVRTSGIIFLFWFLMTILNIPTCKSKIVSQYRSENNVEDTRREYNFVSFFTFFTLSAVLMLLNCFADRDPKFSKYPKSKKECPELAASFLSRITFQWFDKMTWTGFRKPLDRRDLWDLKPEDSSSEIIPVFEQNWQQLACLRTPKNLAKNSNVPEEQPRNVHMRNDSSNNRQKISIMPPIIKSFGGIFLFGSCLKLFQDILMFISPQILRLVIRFVESKSENPEPLWKGILYALLLFGVASIQTLILGQYFHRMFTVGLRIRTALIGTIYRKALVISNRARKETTVGEIVNLMAVDAQRFMDLTTYLNMIWSAPLQISLALYFLWNILGPSVLAGLAVMIFLIPINGFIANKAKILQIKQMKSKDERIKLMSEILSGIKVLKLYAWEPSFEEQVLKVRDKEINILKQTAYLNAGTSFLWSCAPFLVSIVTFTTYVYSGADHILTPEKTFVCLALFDIIKLPLAVLPLLIVYIVEVSFVTFTTYLLVDENNVLDATTAFVSLSLFNILRFPLSMLPMLISNMVQTQVSVRRINKFMNSDELDPNNVQHDSSKQQYPIIIENGSFSWGDDQLILKNVDVKVEQRQLVAIVGSVGCGKSSLLSAILGEMDKISGSVNTYGKIAYVSQQAWVQNASLRDNVLFGNPYDKKKYERVIKACALQQDIDMLSGGDLTEIGEKGINLSGGQKQRISLARAVYSDADIYLLDDPLSAVDSHVGKHIFQEVICSTGLLANKTRILVTHGLTFLPEVDNIIVLRNGEISESGSYQQILKDKDAFADILMQHLQDVNPEDEELTILETQLKDIESKELRHKYESIISRQRSESGSECSNSSKPEGAEHFELRSRKSKERQTSVISEKSEHENQKQKTQLIEEEKAEIGQVKIAVYKHYISSIGVKLALLTIFLTVIFQSFAIGSNLWLSRWSNDKEARNSTTVRDMYLGVYGAFGIGQVFTHFAASLLLALGSLLAAKEMHLFLLHYVFRWPLEMFDTTPLGRVINRFSKDVDVIDNVLPQVLKAWLMQMLAVLATLVVISISTPLFIAAIIPIAIFYYFAQRFYVATSRQLMRLESISRSPIYSHFSETVTGTQIIRAYNVQDRFIKESDQRVDGNQACKYPSVISNRWLAIRLETVGNIIILCSALFAVLGGQTNAGLVGLSVTYSLQITQTLNWLVRMTSDIETNIVSVERIKEYGETKQEAAWITQNSKIPDNWPESGTIKFEEFCVRYREGLELVLKGVTFTINAGEKVGVVGRTGAGKSSLTLSLFRIIEAAGGKITIDGIDISTLGLHSLRSRLTIIPQDPVLFSGTLRNNLDPFEKTSDEEIWSALKQAHLETFVESLAAGLNHEITEGGGNLSVGQRQLICLARALLRKTKIIILDEATAAVDMETDDLIQRTIRSHFHDCTVLTIAHRLNTIMDSERVIVLDKGQVIEFASVTELLQNKKSIFYGMAKDAGLV